MRLATLLTLRLENSFTPLLVTLLVFQGAFPVVYNSRAASLVLTAAGRSVDVTDGAASR